MSIRHNGNGLADEDEADDDFPVPDAILGAMHRDPRAYIDFIRALNRILSSAGEPFTPCTGACPLCHPVLWPDELATES